MRILFCDDNKVIVEQLQKYVSEFFRKSNLKQPEYAAYFSGDDLLSNNEKADIAFLDVEMPGKSGIYVGDELMKRNPRTKVFIVTSYPDYLDEAMKFRVFRFLSKPIDKNRLFYNLKDALYQYSIDTITIPIETDSGVVVCTADEILCFEGKQRKTLVHTIEGDYLSVKGIEYWQENLDIPCMYSSYRSYIINMKYVRSFEKTLISLRYRNQSVEAYLARRKYADFKRKYMLYLESMR